MVADLPWEEADPMRRDLEAQHVDFIPQVAPTTDEQRLGAIGQGASQFVVWTGHSGVEVTLSKESFSQSMETFHEMTRFDHERPAAGE